ncbi:uncharacterized protein BDZ99DRAFT_474419 [Mytilinidion resinicola]|uniref:Uncharacterized protein n=1 Tax=Mytilinidion resinicola TaxID=574789 RepID=A0A6A6YUL0_9PEZI|nr:uncharacterized protein BDZ99DRAFT_474419 [Mytilinidion resinicola]KAF2812209.1 hypothetical protein BDZ99DRAFT_474419 [Mytilinidion resinicola]
MDACRSGDVGWPALCDRICRRSWTPWARPIEGYASLDPSRGVPAQSTTWNAGIPTLTEGLALISAVSMGSSERSTLNEEEPYQMSFAGDSRIAVPGRSAAALGKSLWEDVAVAVAVVGVRCRGRLPRRSRGYRIRSARIAGALAQSFGPLLPWTSIACRCCRREGCGRGEAKQRSKRAVAGAAPLGGCGASEQPQTRSIRASYTELAKRMAMSASSSASWFEVEERRVGGGRRGDGFSSPPRHGDISPAEYGSAAFQT